MVEVNGAPFQGQELAFAHAGAQFECVLPHDTGLVQCGALVLRR
jgi:hypothetical protein